MNNVLSVNIGSVFDGKKTMYDNGTNILEVTILDMRLNLSAVSFANAQNITVPNYSHMVVYGVK